MKHHHSMCACACAFEIHRFEDVKAHESSAEESDDEPVKPKNKGNKNNPFNAPQQV